MSDQAFQDFLAKVELALTKNGFPENKVALPLEKLYESAYEKGVNFNKILEALAQKGVMHEKTSEKIIFQASVPATDSPEEMASAFDKMAQQMGGGGYADMMAQAANMLKSMSPEQLQEMQKMMANLTPQQKEEMMQQAKTMGFPGT